MIVSPTGDKLMPDAAIGLIGLGVMGKNLALNMNDHGFKVAVFNRSPERVKAFMNDEAEGTEIIPADSIEQLIGHLTSPRRVMFMVKAGAAVDELIAQVLPFLAPGDVVIDGGNELYTRTNERTDYLAEQGFFYVGAGISGGEEGARHGPSIMPGGHPEAWPLVKDILQAIAAKVEGEPCCEWVGPGGAGHYVKMVHNGIEYGDMQLICEAYDCLGRGMGMQQPQIASVFADWNQGVLDSYLMDITAKILDSHDDEGFVLARILDRAGQKGTGKWAGINALQQGLPLTLIAESVFARCLSAMKDERVKAADMLGGPSTEFTDRYVDRYVDRSKVQSTDSPDQFVADVRDALYAAKIISYAQGFALLRDAATAYQWPLDYSTIARLWRGGCIIRSVFLADIQRAMQDDPTLENLVLAPFFTHALAQAQTGWRQVLVQAIALGIPMPAMSSALAYYDGYRSAVLPANLLQAQRDYFGAHTYERVDRPRGQAFHTDWLDAGKNKDRAGD